jgi:beta-glucosidase/6-phospho-beta-glucosidase/beta-galactosidase
MVFRSFLMGGFECSSHKMQNDRRLDLISATRHEEFAAADYRRLIDLGMATARDGLRWHLIENRPHSFDFSSLDGQLAAMSETGIQVIWDLFHYGFPDDVDVFSPDFPKRFAAFAAAAAEHLLPATTGPLLICPVNEISFFSWIAGERGYFYPFARKRGNEVKRQLVRAAIAAIDAVRSVTPAARFVHTEPAINVVGPKDNSRSRRAAAAYNDSQFHALDMLGGRREPDLGGGDQYLDVIGLNYYFHNQWRYPNRRKIPLGHSDYKPFREMLRSYFERYRKPLLIAETGIEDDERPNWLRYVSQEVAAAISIGIPVKGICLYPIVNHPGWSDDRHCHNGLWDYVNDANEREVYQPLADEVRSQCERFGEVPAELLFG